MIHIVQQFNVETEAVEQIKTQLRPLFHLVGEVQMQHLDGSKVRMDLIAIAKDTSETAHRFHMIGVEVKVGYPSLRDFNRALKQAIDYRHSRIIDRRSKFHQGAIPEFVFVYPDYPQLPLTPGSPYGNWYHGSVRLAGMFNVGVIRDLAPRYWRNPSYAELEFRVSDTPIWRSKSGLAGGAGFGTARRRGAA